MHTAVRSNHIRPGLILIGLGIIIMVIFVIFLEPICQVFSRVLSPDGQITQAGKIKLISAVYFGAILLVAAGFVLNLAGSFSRRKRLKAVFLSDPLARAPDRLLPPGKVLILSTLSGLMLSLFMLLAIRRPWLFNFLYAKDQGLLDLFTPTLMLISMVLILITIFRIWKARAKQTHWRQTTVIYLGMVGLFLFDAGEETSWGQDFFRWRTPTLFAGNVENQTNLHNYFNSYFDYGYIALSVILLVVLFSAGLEYQQKWLAFKQLYLPHPSMIGLALIIAFVAVIWYTEQELLEEMVAVFVLFHSIRIYRCFRPVAAPAPH